MIDPGRLKTRLVLQAPVESDDGQGGMIVSDYATVAVVWAALLPSNTRREVSADADGASMRVRVILRNAYELTLQHRLVDSAKIYRIVTLREIDDGRFAEIEAEWRID
jgi:head-tail adaptor